MPVYDSQGRLVQLGAELGRGGEGSVFDVADQPQHVAKLYHQTANTEKATKLSLMVRLHSERLQRVAAWPTDILHDKPGGSFVGFLMPKVIGHKPIHSLYGPKDRLRSFPNADWRFLIHAAANLASAFAVVHEHGHIIGDVNHGNFVISDEATIKVIDCDSFQITTPRNQYLCEVGVSTHTPPELQGQPLTVARTINHDAFGLAVLIFQLLFMGRHPFSGKYLRSDEMPLEKAIREFRFAYGSNASSYQMERPPASLPLNAVSQQVGTLFERAFSPETNRQGGRPSPHDWVTALGGLFQNLKSCNRHSGHHYLNILPSCPWCYIESRSGFLLFNFVVAGGNQPVGAFNLDAIWVQIMAVPAPGPIPQLPAINSLSTKPSPLAIQQRNKHRMKKALAGSLIVAVITSVFILQLDGCASFGLVIGALWLAVVIASAGVEQVRGEAEKLLKEAKARWQSVERQWQIEASDAKFFSKRRELELLKARFQDLPNLRLRKLQQLETERIEKQLYKFLDGYPINSANIPQIGPSRQATLMSYGIETAADITDSAVSQVPGFGPHRIAIMRAWRHSIEIQFVFDPNQPIDPNDIAAVERETVATRFKLEQELLQGLMALRQISQEITTKREYLRPTVDGALRALAQAEADKMVV